MNGWLVAAVACTVGAVGATLLLLYYAAVAVALGVRRAYTWLTGR